MQSSNAIPWGALLLAFVVLSCSGVIDVDPVLTVLAEIGDAFNNHFGKGQTRAFQANR